MFGKRLKELREEKGLSMDKLVDLYNQRYDAKMNKSTLSRYENGLQTPIFTVVANLANFFNVSVDYISGNSDSAKLLPPTITEETVSFPVLGEIAAGYDMIANEDWSGETVEIPLEYLRGRPKSDYFVLRVHGDSMYPQYQDNDIVLILKQTTLNRSGEIGAVLYEDDIATLKKIEYVKGEDWLELIPLNLEFKPKRIEGEDLDHCRILGIPKLLLREI